MGLCISSKPDIHRNTATESRNPPTIKIILPSGKLQELDQPIKAKHLIADNPNCFLSNSESMSIGSRVPHVQEDEELQLGQIYFLLPVSEFDGCNTPLSLPDLCALAVKASSAIGQYDAVDLRFSSSKLILR